MATDTINDRDLLEYIKLLVATHGTLTRYRTDRDKAKLRTVSGEDREGQEPYRSTSQAYRTIMSINDTLLKMEKCHKRIDDEDKVGSHGTDNSMTDGDSRAELDSGSSDRDLARRERLKARLIGQLDNLSSQTEDASYNTEEVSLSKEEVTAWEAANRVLLAWWKWREDRDRLTEEENNLLEVASIISKLTQRNRGEAETSLREPADMIRNLETQLETLSETLKTSNQISAEKIKRLKRRVEEYRDDVRTRRSVHTKYSAFAGIVGLLGLVASLTASHAETAQGVEQSTVTVTVTRTPVIACLQTSMAAETHLLEKTEGALE